VLVPLEVGGACGLTQRATIEEPSGQVAFPGGDRKFRRIAGGGGIAGGLGRDRLQQEDVTLLGRMDDYITARDSHDAGAGPGEAWRAVYPSADEVAAVFVLPFGDASQPKFGQTAQRLLHADRTAFLDLAQAEHLIWGANRRDSGQAGTTAAAKNSFENPTRLASGTDSCAPVLAYFKYAALRCSTCGTIRLS